MEIGLTGRISLTSTGKQFIKVSLSFEHLVAHISLFYAPKYKNGSCFLLIIRISGQLSNILRYPSFQCRSHPNKASCERGRIQKKQESSLGYTRYNIYLYRKKHFILEENTQKRRMVLKSMHLLLLSLPY